MEMGAGWEEEKPVHQQEAVAQPASEGGGMGVWRSAGEVNGIRQHARANLKCNHHSKYERLYLLKLMKQKKAFLGFCENT